MQDVPCRVNAQGGKFRTKCHEWKMWEWNVQDQKMQDKMSGLENKGPRL